MNETSKQMTAIVYDALDEKLGIDIEMIRIDEISPLADYMVIVSGNSPSHISAMIDMVEEKMLEAGFKSKKKEGKRESTWILMDYGDVIVHFFSKEDRMFYDLERIWRDGKKVEREEL